MDSTQLDNASFFPFATIKPAIKTAHLIESIGRMSLQKTDELPSFLQMPIIGVPYLQPPSVQLPAGVMLGRDLSISPHLFWASTWPLMVIPCSLQLAFTSFLLFTYNICPPFLGYSVMLWLQNWDFFLPHFSEPPVPLLAYLRRRNVIFLVSLVPRVNCEVVLLMSQLSWKLANWWRWWQTPREKQSKTENVWILDLKLLLDIPPCVEKAFQVP